MSNHVKLVIVHGDKGGVGKSTAATVIASYLTQQGRRLMVLETDVGDSGATPDVGPRFADAVGVDVTHMALETPNRHTRDTLADLFELIESSRAEYVVMNLPAGASRVLEDVGTLLAAAAEASNVEVRIAYVLDRTDSALANAEALVQGPIFGCAARSTLVRNEAIATAREYDRRLNTQPFARRLTRSTVPELSPDTADLLTEHGDRNLLDLIDPDTTPLRTVQRLQIAQWFNAAAESLQAALFPELSAYATEEAG